MPLKYKIGDLVRTNMDSHGYDTIPNGTVTRIKGLFGDFGYYIEDQRSHGWWSENQLLPYNPEEKKKSGFAKWISKYESS